MTKGTKIPTPKELAEELVEVQPMSNVNFKALANDPLANALLKSFLERNTKGSK